MKCSNLLLRNITFFRERESHKHQIHHVTLVPQPHQRHLQQRFFDNAALDGAMSLEVRVTSCTWRWFGHTKLPWKKAGNLPTVHSPFGRWDFVLCVFHNHGVIFDDFSPARKCSCVVRSLTLSPGAPGGCHTMPLGETPRLKASRNGPRKDRTVETGPWRRNIHFWIPNKW